MIGRPVRLLAGKQLFNELGGEVVPGRVEEEGACAGVLERIVQGVPQDRGVLPVPGEDDEPLGACGDRIGGNLLDGGQQRREPQRGGGKRSPPPERGRDGAPNGRTGSVTAPSRCATRSASAPTMIESVAIGRCGPCCSKEPTDSTSGLPAVSRSRSANQERAPEFMEDMVRSP